LVGAAIWWTKKVVANLRCLVLSAMQEEQRRRC